MKTLSCCIPVFLIMALAPASAGIIQTLTQDAAYISDRGFMPTVDTEPDSITNGILTVDFLEAKQVNGMGKEGKVLGDSPDPSGSTPRILYDPLAGLTAKLTFSDPVRTLGLDTEHDLFEFQIITRAYSLRITNPRDGK